MGHKLQAVPYLSRINGALRAEHRVDDGLLHSREDFSLPDLFMARVSVWKRKKVVKRDDTHW